MKIYRSGQKFVALLDSFKDGQAQSAFAGGEFQFAPGTYGIDFHTEPGVIKPVYDFLNDVAGDVETYHSRGLYQSSDLGGSQVHSFDQDSVNVNKVSIVSLGASTSSRTVKDDDTNNWAVGGRIVEFDDYLMAYQTGGIRVAKFGTLTGGGYTISLNQTGALGNTSTYGLDMLVAKSFLYYCNGRYVGRASAHNSWNDTALSLSANERTVGFASYGDYIIVGSIIVNDAGYSRLYRWDGISTIIDGQPIIIPDTGLRAVLNIGGSIICICVTNPVGAAGVSYLRFYRWDGGSDVQLIREIDLENTIVSSFNTTVYPGATDSYNNKLWFAVYAPTASTMGISNGVYSLTKDGVLNLEYVDDGGTLTNMGFHYVKWINGHLVALWDRASDGATTFLQTVGGFGASISYSTNAILQTLNMRFDPFQKTQIDRIRFGLKSLPASTSVRVRHSADQASLATAKTFSTTATKLAKIENQTEYTFQPGNIHNLEFKLVGSGSSKPEMLLPIVIEGNILQDQQ